MHSGANPSPGLGIARSLRLAGLHLHLTGLDYSPESSGLHSELLDSRIVLPGWKEIDLDTWTSQIGDVVGPDALFVASLDLEVRLAAEAFSNRPQFLSPKRDALERVTKPPRAAAEALGMASAASLTYTGNDDEVDDFIRRSRAGVWVKGQHYEAVRAATLGQALAAGRRIDTLWGGPWHLERHVPGQEAGIAVAAREGVLLGAVMMRKSVLTADGKTWAGAVSEVDDCLLGPLRTWVKECGWHGGAELEVIEHWDQSLTLMEINPRFPAWIHGASLTVANLPAALITGHQTTTASVSAARSGSFTRVVEELPIHPAVGAPAFPWSSSDYASAAAKHPSGMPDIARRSLVADPSLVEPDLTELGATRPPLRSGSVTQCVRLGNVPLDTPILRVDPTSLTERLELVRDAMPAGHTVEFCYSVKTNPEPGLIAAALEADMLIEVISQDELELARSLGTPPARVVLNGPAKWWPTPGGRFAAGRSSGSAAVRANAIFMDSVPEFEVLEALLASGVQVETKVLGLRLARRGMQSRFGVAIDEGEDLLTAARLLKSMCARLNARWGVHFHTTQSVVGVDRWVEDCAASLRGARLVSSVLGEGPAVVDFGGGWHPRDLDALPDAVARVVEQLRGDVDFEVPWLFELGKSLLEPCGTLLTRVIVAPNSRGDVVVDAGLSDLPEGPFWPHPVSSVASDGTQQGLAGGGGRILGRTCMERDVLAVDLDLSRLRCGDLLAIGRAGGYDSSMAYPFGRGRRFEVVAGA